MYSNGTNIYIASCTETGGIYHYIVANDGFTLVDITKMDRPMYMTIKDNKMYIILRAPFDNEDSGVIIYDIGNDGNLINPSKIVSTKGKVACHIAVFDNHIYCANYVSGSVIMLPDMKIIQHSGCGIHPERQESPHVHYVGITPDNRYLCVTDLGLDTIFLYNLDMSLHSSFKVPAGHGVRHLVFSEDGKYLFAINELQSTVAMFLYYDGNLKLMDVQSAIPYDCKTETTAAAIKIKEGILYASNRGHDSISILKFEYDRLQLLNNFDCGGATPRDIEFAGKYLICTNQDSNTVTVFDSDDNFQFVTQLEVKSPVCVCVHS